VIWNKRAATALAVTGSLLAGCASSHAKVAGAPASEHADPSTTAAATVPADTSAPDPTCDAAFARLVPRHVPADLQPLPLDLSAKPALQERVRLYSSDPSRPVAASRGLSISMWCPAAAGPHPGVINLKYKDAVVSGHSAKFWHANDYPGAGIVWSRADGSAIQVETFGSVNGTHNRLLSDDELLAVANSLP
jgi:hypothetical protein